MSGPQIHFPGPDGIPVRTYQPILGKLEDVAQKLMQLHDGFARQFMMNSADDAAEYNRVVDLAAKGLATIVTEERAYDPGLKSFVVFVRWQELFWENPAETIARIRSNDAGRIYFKPHNDQDPDPAGTSAGG